MTQQEWITEVLSWVGTPFRWQGRAKGDGSDCWGMVVASGWNCGYIPTSWDVKGYTRRADLAGLSKENLPLWFDEVPPKQVQPGDVVTMHHQAGTMHMGVIYSHPFGGLGIIHSDDYRHIVQHRLSEGQRQLITQVWRPRYEQ